MIQNIELERFLIGHLISYPVKQKKTIRALSEKDFTIDAHIKIWNEIESASQKGAFADITYLISKGFKEQSIFELTSSVPVTMHSENYDYWVSELRELTILRTISENCTEAIGKIKESSSDEILNELSLANIECRKLSLNINSETNTDAVNDFYKSVERAKNNDGINGIELFGIPGLDKILSGGEPGDLIIVAGRPGMGKSVVIVNAAVQAIKQGLRLVVWTLEMSTLGYVQRIISALCSASYEAIREGNVKKEDVSDALKRFEQSRVKIIDKSGVSIDQIYNTLLNEHEKEPIDAVCIDHLGLISGKGKLYEVITRNSNQAKVIAKELKIPLVMLCQLSRNVEHRGGNKEPQLSDLRDSGAIEQDADKIIFPFRPSYYEPEIIDPQSDFDKFIIAKNRGGKSNTFVKVRFSVDDMLFHPFYNEDNNYGFNGSIMKPDLSITPF